MKTPIIIVVILVALGAGWYLFTQTGSGRDATPDIGGTAGTANQEDTLPIKGSGDTEVSAPVHDVVLNLTGKPYEFSQKEIRVKKGDRVTVNLTSTEGLHDWVVDEFYAATDRVTAGNTSSVTFVADQAGSFEYYCSVADHRARGMVGTLVVEE